MSAHTFIRSCRIYFGTLFAFTLLVERKKTKYAIMSIEERRRSVCVTDSFSGTFDTLPPGSTRAVSICGRVRRRLPSVGFGAKREFSAN